jgi:monoamine oxidase
MPSTRDEKKIAIVGGGIAGLFCALVLTQKEKSFCLFESSNRFGGRIRTIRLDKNNAPLAREWDKNKLEFYVEFGPMRVELDKQRLLKSLLSYLEIEPKTTGEEPGAYLTPFPSYASPTSSRDPRYDLRPEEKEKTPLELLRLALLRVIAHVDVAGTSFADEQETLIKQISLAAATQESVDRIFEKWMRGLTSDHHWELQTRGKIGRVPLYAIGFWNLLSDYLSHGAISKLRDLGTFYHLLPENPNAAEWLVWWLIGFAISEQLQGVFGGMECIVEKLQDKLDGTKLKRECHVTKIERTASDKFKLCFSPDSKPDVSASQEYDRIILALPKSALQKIMWESKTVIEPSEPEIYGLLDSVFGFPMVKMFVVVKNRWWEEDNRANLYATRVPTRELHYWKGHTANSRQGLIMAYTDRPASSFWANYVPPGAQADVHTKNGTALPETFRDRLTDKVVQYIKENEVLYITNEDIVWYGIRDWGRSPYGGANHAWRPERKHWLVMSRLADIGSQADKKAGRGIHVCGEAYSDYHGFIEGSLRSAVYVLHKILDVDELGAAVASRLPWLTPDTTEGTEGKLRVTKGYLDDLRRWTEHLDNAPQEAYVYDGR